MTGARRRRLLAGVAAGALLSACGADASQDAGGDTGPGSSAVVTVSASSAMPTTSDSPVSESTTGPTSAPSVTPSTSSPPFEPIAVDCGAGRPGEDRALVAAQELVFDGTVLRIEAERNPEAEFRTTFLDDGQEDPGGPVPDESDLDDPDAGAVWPWTTFDVHAWFTDDWGEEITIWTAGLDLEVGDRVLIAGEAFTTAVPENVGHSGMAVVCTSAVRSAALAATWHDWFGGSVVPGAERPEGTADPATVAQIEAARARWRELEPASYSAELSLGSGSGGEAEDGPCPESGAVRIVVTNGVVTSAVNAYLGCRIDVASSDVPTIDDLFDDAITAQAAAVGHSVTLDETWGYPIAYYGYDRSVEIGGGVSWFHPAATTTLVDGELDAALAERRAQWIAAGPSRYTFLLDRLCFCGEVGPYLVTVADGETVSITDPEGRPVRGDVLQYLPGTIDALFDEIDARVGVSDLVIATFDDELGHPVTVYVDEIANAVDDEVTYVVRDLTSVPEG